MTPEPNATERSDRCVACGAPDAPHDCYEICVYQESCGTRSEHCLEPPSHHCPLFHHAFVPAEPERCAYDFGGYQCGTLEAEHGGDMSWLGPDAHPFTPAEPRADAPSADAFEACRRMAESIVGLAKKGDMGGAHDTASRLCDAVDAAQRAQAERIAALESEREALSLRNLQDELRPWQEYNFPNRPAWQPLLGVMEEAGELAHAHLKQVQAIRLEEDHEAKARDAVADIVVYLADYCNARGFDFQSCLEAAWSEVKERDWQRHRAALSAGAGE